MAFGMLGCLQGPPGSLAKEQGAESCSLQVGMGGRPGAGLSFTVLCVSVCLVADDPIRLLREVVLLTDDRNLRVKALTRNVPVRDIPTFLKWAQEG